MVILISVFFVVILFLSLKCYGYDLGSWSNFMIMFANITMAASALYGVIEAKSWLKKRMVGDIFKKKQNITYDIVNFKVKIEKYIRTLNMIFDNFSDISSLKLPKQFDDMLIKLLLDLDECIDKVKCEYELVSITSDTINSTEQRYNEFLDKFNKLAIDINGHISLIYSVIFYNDSLSNKSEIKVFHDELIEFQKCFNELYSSYKEYLRLIKY